MKPLSLLAAAVFLVAASGIAEAQSTGGSFVTPGGKTVYRSGSTYFVNACEPPSRRGRVQCYAKIVTDAKGNPFATSTSTKGYTAADLRSAYGLGPVPTGFDIAVQPVVAVVIPYHHPKLEANLTVYRQTMGLPPCTTGNGCLTIIYQDGTLPPAPPAGSNWGVEASLDTQMVSAACPQCRITVYEAQSADSARTSVMVQTAAAAGAIAVSNSYGTTEANWFADSSIYNDAVRYQSSTAAIVFASGDSGYGVNCPACLNTVLAVGGTKLSKTTTGRKWSETAWTKGGSGCDRDTSTLSVAHAALYARPAWNVQTMLMPSPGVCGRRMVADVSAVADPSTGVAVYAACGFNGILFGTSSWCVIGGTSVAAPLWAGIIGNRGPIAGSSFPPECAGVTTQNRIGCFLYFKAASLANGVYSYNASNSQTWDVNSGSNGSCGSSILCTAKAGYDGPTGLGTPKAGVLAP